MARTAPKNSFLNKIYIEKRFKTELIYPDGKSNLCIINNSFDAAQIKLHLQFELTNYFILMSKTTLLLLLSYFTTNIENLIIFKNEVNYYELNLIHYLRSNLKNDRKIYLLSKLTDYFEKGFYIDIFNKFHRGLFGFIEKRSIIYSNLDAYIDDYTRLENLKVHYFKNLFCLLLYIQLVILFIFLFHLLIKKNLPLLFK